jgi:eukaryotic-like serine/threonine-protein kinase
LNLEDMVRVHGPLPRGRVCHFLRQACAALQEAHSIGLIHRDIKPANLIVCERGGVHDVLKVLDFGLVRDCSAAQAGVTLTAEGVVAGTPAYMSPEQAAGVDQLDACSDVYSIGAVAYFLLTGQPPSADRTQVQVLAAHLYEAPRPPMELQAGMPADLSAIVLKCLAKSPGDRFADAQRLDAAVANLAVASDWREEVAARWWKDHCQHASTP